MPWTEVVHTSIRFGTHRLVSKISDAISNPAEFLKKELMLNAVDDKLELCLVCEVCWRPQRDGAYDVTTQSDLCAKVREHTLCMHTLCVAQEDVAYVPQIGDAGCKGDALHDQSG